MVDSEFSLFTGTRSALLPSRILYEDAGCLVADKPVRMPVEASDRLQRDDLVSHLASLLLDRDGETARSLQLRAVQHLDRDTSGVVLIAKNAASLKQLSVSGGPPALRVAFVAAVTGKIPQGKTTSLRGFAAKHADGRVIVSTTGRGNAAALTGACTAIERAAGRAIVEIETDHGGSRHVRALLAAYGLKVAGDELHGGAPCHRLMLHAARLSLRQPGQGARITASSPLPWDFTPWLQDRLACAKLDGTTLRACVREAALARADLWRSADTTAFRLFHGEGEGVPGLDVDRFGDHAIVWLDAELGARLRQEAAQAAWALGPRSVHVKVRPKTASRLDDAARELLAPVAPVLGEAPFGEFAVLEHGMTFAVRLDDGLATGLFLDQRDTRGWVREHAKGLRVLNLFAYTCAFTLAAAAGGAASTVSVDISARALETGLRNLQSNGWGGSAHEFVRDDVQRWLKSAGAKGKIFDLIVLDPPSFGTSKHGRFSTEADYANVAQACISLVADAGGIVIACTNNRGVPTARLRGWLKMACERAGRSIAGMRDCPSQLDFPAPSIGEPHLKVVRLAIAPR